MTAPQESARAHVGNALQIFIAADGWPSRDEIAAIKDRLFRALAALDGEARERENDTALMDYAQECLVAADFDYRVGGEKIAALILRVPIMTGIGADLRRNLAAAKGTEASLAPLPSVTSEATPLLDEFAARGRAVLGGSAPVVMTNTTSED